MLASLWPGLEANAVDRTWVGSANDNFISGSNWNPAGVPGNADTTIISVGQVTPPYNVLFYTGLFQPINVVVDRLRIDSNPIQFTIPTSTLTIDSTNITETGRGLLIGRLGSGTPNAQLDNLLSQLNTVYATLGSDTGTSGTLNVNGGTFNVTGSGAVMDLIIGRNGAGTINVNNGSDVTVADDTALGLNAGSSGAINVSGAGSYWSNDGDVHIGGLGAGAVNVIAGGVLESSNSLVGSSAGSNGSATVDGMDSRWTSAAGLRVADFGSGMLDVTNGGRVYSTHGYIGNQSGSTGIVTISGASSGWSSTGFGLSGDLYIGNAGDGALHIASGGEMLNDTGYIGYAPGSSGTVTLNDAGSQWINYSELHVGEGGDGTLHISVDADVTSDGAVIASLASSTATATITDTGSTWTNNGTLVVGSVSGAHGAIDVSGNSSLLSSSGDATIGLGGDGTLDISANGHVANFHGYVGYASGATGHVTIDGADSEWKNSNPLYLGYSGQATIGVTNGARMISAAEAYLGFLGDGSASVTIQGNDSEWVHTGALLGAANELHVGYHGDGTVAISGGASLVVVTSIHGANVSIGHFFGSTGTMTIDGADSFWVLSAAHDIQIDVALSGQGTLEITNGATANITSVGSSGLDDIKLQIGHLQGALGVVTVDGAGSKLSMDSFRGATSVDVGFGGAGTLNIANSGQLELTGPITVGGAIGTMNITSGGQVSCASTSVGTSGSGLGSVNVTSGGILQTGDVTVGPHGELRGDGTIVANVSNDGLVSPGTSPGALHVDGDYTQTAGSELLIELSSASSYDQLLITSRQHPPPSVATLNGTLTVELIDGFVPSPGESFTILTADFVTGAFAQVNVPDGMQVTYAFQSVTLETIASPCPADIAPQPNGDGMVNVADMLMVINNWGPCPGCPADVNGDGATNVADLLAIINGWGLCP